MLSLIMVLCREKNSPETDNPLLLEILRQRCLPRTTSIRPCRHIPESRLHLRSVDEDLDQLFDSMRRLF